MVVPWDIDRMQQFDLIVVGGGPAGFFGALRFASLCPKASILILEKDECVLQKLLISGGGRCNITHDCNDPRELIKFYPRGGKALLNAFYQFGPQELLAWFIGRGLNFYRDPAGCYFPLTDKAQSVVDVLVSEADHLGIQTWTGTGMEQLIQNLETGDYEVSLTDGQQISSPYVLVATGGSRQGFKVLQGLGIAITKPIPSLFAFQLQDPFLSELAGITIDRVELSLPGTPFRQSGALLITHRGLSGPVVINLSAWAARILHDAGYRHNLVIDWLAGRGHTDRSLAIVKENKQAFGSKQVGKTWPFEEIPERLWQRLLSCAGLSTGVRWGDLSLIQLDSLNQELRHGNYLITGRDAHRQEYVTCGGVDLKEVDLSGFESRTYPGLCFAGEVLDIDGLTGGYNLQNCWTTGWIAGERLARKKPEI
jgi:predicted Rossmann fold flavoprotein